MTAQTPRDVLNGNLKSTQGVTNDDAFHPLRVLIIGGGLGGLTTGIALRRAGHRVTVFERSQLASEYGAAINVPPNAGGVLKRLGVNVADTGAVEMKWFTEYDKPGEFVKHHDFTVKSRIWQHQFLLAHRVDLHTQLKNAAISTEGRGTPVELLTGSPVADVSPQNRSLTLKDGTIWTGDLIVGADGVHSVSRKCLTSKLPFSSGKSAYRFVLNKSDVTKHPHLAPVVERDGEMIFWFSQDRRIVMYPTRENKLLNFVCIHPDAVTKDPAHAAGWNQSGSVDDLLAAFEGFDPRALGLLSMADPSTLKKWALMDMGSVDKWHEGSFCLIGDAAHPFLPHQGQGAAQAIEDGVTLGTLLPLGTSADEVPERLQLYQACRKERAEYVQHVTRLAGEDLAANSREHGKMIMSFFDYNCGHDAHDHATQALQNWLYKERGNIYWRMPISFGVSPSPRQDLHGKSFNWENSAFVTRTIKFKTSRTLLQNLLPTSAFSFPDPSTFAYASYVTTTLGRLPWLAGRGYDHWALYLHDVQYKKQDGTHLKGDFLALMVENDTDPILTGREELGFPKVYSEIVCTDSPRSSEVASSWHQASYLKFTLDDLQDAEVPQHALNDGILTYKYVPATGRPGVADAEYAVCCPNSPNRSVHRFRTTKNAGIKIGKQSENELPTLQHIVSRLAELPVYEIVEGSVAEGTGVDDFSSAFRVE